VIAYGTDHTDTAWCDLHAIAKANCGCPEDLAQAIHQHLTRFVAFPNGHYAVAATLWVFHAHTADAAESTPRLAFLSPEPGSGKSRALEVLATLVPNPMEAVNATPAALFRSVGNDRRPTILFDEIDTIFGPKAKDNEEVRGFLNAGHRRGAVAYRCVGPHQEVQPFPAFCAVAIAGLHDLPDTLAQRAVIVPMRRRAPGETVEPFRGRIHRPEGEHLRDQLADWAVAHLGALEGHVPFMPPGVTDRPADLWEPLLSIAETLGGGWLDRARDACIEIVTAATTREPSLSVRLLHDLREIFGEEAFLPTVVILERLRAIEEAPWATYGTAGLTARNLATKLREYGVARVTERVNAETVKGYRRNDLADPWSRYLPPLDPRESVTTETTVTASLHAVPDVSVVTDSPETEGRCLSCGLPMEDDYLGDGCHAACTPITA
jgi:hypothetical protein